MAAGFANMNDLTVIQASQVPFLGLFLALRVFDQVDMSVCI